MFTVKQYNVHVGNILVSADRENADECVDATNGRIDYIIKEYTDELNENEIIDMDLAILDRDWQAWKKLPEESGKKDLEDCKYYGTRVEDILNKLEAARKKKLNPDAGGVDSSFGEPSTSTPSTSTPATSATDTSTPYVSIPGTKSTPGTIKSSSVSKPSSYSPIASLSGSTSKPLWPLLIAAAGIGVVIYSKYGMKTA